MTMFKYSRLGDWCSSSSDVFVLSSCYLVLFCLQNSSFIAWKLHPDYMGHHCHLLLKLVFSAHHICEIWDVLNTAWTNYCSTPAEFCTIVSLCFPGFALCLKCFSWYQMLNCMYYHPSLLIIYLDFHHEVYASHIDFEHITDVLFASFHCQPYLFNHW